MPAVAKEYRRFIDSIQSTINIQPEQNIESCNVVLTDILVSNLVTTVRTAIGADSTYCNWCGQYVLQFGEESMYCNLVRTVCTAIW